MRRLPARTGWWVAAGGAAPEPDAAGDSLHVDDALEEPGPGERQEPELDGGGEAAGRGDEAGAADALAVQLGQPVDEVGEHPRMGVGLAVVPLVGGGVLEPEVAGHVDDLHRGQRRDLRHLLRGHLVGKAEKDDVHPVGGGGRGEVLEDEGGAPLERRMAAPSGSPTRSTEATRQSSTPGWTRSLRIISAPP